VYGESVGHSLAAKDLPGCNGAQLGKQLAKQEPWRLKVTSKTIFRAILIFICKSLPMTHFFSKRCVLFDRLAGNYNAQRIFL